MPDCKTMNCNVLTLFAVEVCGDGRAVGSCPITVTLSAHCAPGDKEYLGTLLLLRDLATFTIPAQPHRCVSQHTAVHNADYLALDGKRPCKRRHAVEFCIARLSLATPTLETRFPTFRTAGCRYPQSATAGCTREAQGLTSQDQKWSRH